MHGVRSHPVCARQAFEEISVYLRALSAARRRWGKDIARHEQTVRRCMHVEDQCRARLRRQMMRGTLQSLHWLVQTDLLRPASHCPPKPPPLALLQRYDIPAAQASGFALFVFSHLQPNLDRVCVPPLVLLADMQSRWAVLPRCDKQVYDRAAESYRPHLRQTVWMEQTRAEKGAAGAVRRQSKARKSQKQTEQHAEASSQEQSQPKRSATTQRVKCTRNGKAEHSVHAEVRTEACESATQEEEGVVDDTAAEAARRASVSNHKHNYAKNKTSNEEDAAAAAADRWEQQAFRRFARLSLRQMQAALGAGAPLQSKEWVPIAQAEWVTKSHQQKRIYVKEREEDEGDEED